MVYNGDDNGDKGNGDDEIDSSDCCLESTDPVLGLLPNLYSELNIFPL